MTIGAKGFETLDWAGANNVRIEKGFFWTGREIVPFKEEESACGRNSVCRLKGWLIAEL